MQKRLHAGLEFSIITDGMKWTQILMGGILLLPQWVMAQAFLNTTSDQRVSQGKISATLKSTFLKNTLGFDYIHAADYAISAPSIKLLFGLGPTSEMELNWDIMRFTKAHQGKSTADVSDASFFTNIQLVQENTLPSFSIRLGAKLPNASNESYAGTDKTDVFMYSIFGKQFGKLHLFTNLGFELLGHPKHPGQDDVLGYGIASSYFLTPHWSLAFEFWGRRDNHWDSPLNQASFKEGISFVDSSWKMEIGISQGLISQSESLGATSAITKTFSLL